MFHIPFFKINYIYVNFYINTTHFKIFNLLQIIYIYYLQCKPIKNFMFKLIFLNLFYYVLGLFYIKYLIDFFILT